MLTVHTTLEPFGPATAIILTDEQVAELAAVKNPPVIVTIEGRSTRLRVARMSGQNCIGLSKAARAALGVNVGDEITATIELDGGERTVDLPPDLAEALQSDPAANAAFAELSYSKRKEHARSVADAKKPETRARRLEKVMDSLRS